MKIKITIQKDIITATLVEGGDTMSSVVSYPIETLYPSNPYQRWGRAPKRDGGLFKKAGEGKWVLQGQEFVSRYADQVKSLYNHFPDETATIEDLRSQG